MQQLLNLKPAYVHKLSPKRTEFIDTKRDTTANPDNDHLFLVKRRNRILFRSPPMRT